MDQIKIGAFLKELRSGKNLTQEALAEQFSVTRRTVSRWETGSNLPDLDLLLELSDFYGVEVRELLAGERRQADEGSERDTVLLLKDFTREESEKMTRRLHGAFLVGVVCFGVNFVLECLDLHTPAAEFLRGVTFGLAMSVTAIGAILTSRHAGKIRRMKRKWIGRGE